MVLVSVSIKICIWQKDRTQLNQFSRYTLYTYNIFTSLRLSSLYTSCPRTIQSWTALTWRCLEERNGSISRRSGAPAYRAMFRQLAFFDFIGSLEILTDCGGFWPTLSACPDRLGKFLKSVRPSGQIWVNLGPLCPDEFGGIWWFARSGFLTYNPGSFPDTLFTASMSAQ